MGSWYGHISLDASSNLCWFLFTVHRVKFKKAFLHLFEIFLPLRSVKGFLLLPLLLRCSHWCTVRAKFHIGRSSRINWREISVCIHIKYFWSDGCIFETSFMNVGTSLLRAYNLVRSKSRIDVCILSVYRCIVLQYLLSTTTLQQGDQWLAFTLAYVVVHYFRFLSKQ